MNSRLIASAARSFGVLRSFRCGDNPSRFCATLPSTRAKWSRAMNYRTLWSSKPADQNASVGQCIKEIRRATGHDARWIIRTVSGRGYQFIAEVVRTEPLEPDLLISPELPANSQPPSSSRLLGGTTAGRRPQSFVIPGSLRQRTMVAAIVVTAALAVWGWLIGSRPQPAAAVSLTMMAAPSIAVRPFTVLGTGDGR